MTFVILGLGWLLLGALVSPRGRRAIWRLRPRTQVAAALLAALGLVTVPLSALLLILSRVLTDAGPMSLLAQCRRVVTAILGAPWLRPGLTAALVLLSAALAGIGLGAISAWRSQASSWALIRHKRDRCVVVPSDEAFAFTAGLVRPRVVVSQGLLGSVPAEWPGIVLAHEEAHRRGRHPLLIFVAESLARGIPLVPMRWAADTLRLALEAVADDAASKQSGDPALVAEAVAGLALASAGAVPGFEGNEVQRVRRLLSQPAPPSGIVTTVLVAGLAGLLLFGAAHGVHCGETSIRSLAVYQCPLRLH